MEASDLNLRFSKNLRRIREAVGLSQEELGARCDLHRTYIGSIERGERNITLQTVTKIAMALGVNPLDLLQEPRL